MEPEMENKNRGWLTLLLSEGLKIDHIPHLWHKIHVEREHQTRELMRRIGLGYKWKDHIFKADFPILLTVFTYGAYVLQTTL